METIDNNLKVSVVLATFNGEKYITKQLESILYQTTKADEVIISDDCSTDSTLEIVNNFITENSLSEKWSVFSNDQNLGYVKNFCSALEKANGDIIFLCDQDDIWNTEKLSSVLPLFDDFDVFGVATNYKLINSNDQPIDFANKKANLSDEISYGSLMFGNKIPGCCCAFRRRVTKEYLRTSTNVLPHDWEMSILASLYGKYLYVENELVSYRIHESNTIGIAGIGGKSLTPKYRSSFEKRVAIFKEQKALGNIFENIHDLDSNHQEKLKIYKRFIKNREDILFNKKFLPTFSNLVLYPKLVKFSNISLRGVLGDILLFFRRK